MIICSCNVLSESQILATLKLGADLRPGTAYRCLGCAPRCGRCVETVRALLVKAHLENCQVGCADCPAAEAHRHQPAAEAETEAEAEVEVAAPMLIAAE